MLGVKMIKIKTSKDYTLEELLEKMQGITFLAGEPSLVKHGFNNVIAFPPEDRENQVWVIKTKGGFTVQRSVVIAGVKEWIKNAATADVLNELSGGITGMVSMFGKPKKDCMAHCDDVAEKIKALNL